MSSTPLALSAVTSLLQTCLSLVYNGSALGTVNISAVAPDLVESKFGIGADSGLRVNLFLHQVTPNAAWRNIDLPSLAADGATRLKNPPLALDLHYLLTAYAADDTEAEALLGYAILMLHENPILPRSLITNILNTLPANTYHNAIKNSGLDSQIEMIKILPATLGREEMAWLWTALKADYRPTFPFQASVVLMRNEHLTAFSLPVLTRNIIVQPGVSAQLFQAASPYDQSAAVVGDAVTITGSSLGAATILLIVNPTTHVTYQFTPPAGAIQDTRVAFTVPDDPVNLPAGVCQASLLFTNSAGLVTQHTNMVVIGIGLKISAAPAPTAAPGGGGTRITLTCDPQVRTGQAVYLVLDSNVVAAQPFTGPTSSLTFQFQPALATGAYDARLQVDGVLTPAASKWNFTAPSTITVAP